MYYIGIDLGGTNVAAGLVSREGEVLGRASVPTPRGAEAVAVAIEEAARQSAWAAGVPLEKAASVGLTAPGTIDPGAGVVHRAVNMGLENVPLSELVTARLGLPCTLENDANAAALGEYVAGAGRGFRSLMAVTLGTGVGAGAVLEGKLYTGFNYAALEAGHTVIRQGGRQCNCGRRGCWETYASATGLIRTTREAMEANRDSALWQYAPTLEQVSGKTAFDAAQAGDPSAQAVLGRYVEDLACGMINLINLFQPEVLCVSGGVARQGERLLAPVRAVLDREEYTRQGPARTQLRIAQLGDDAGVIGAALVPVYR